jgi:hypothetical protein
MRGVVVLLVLLAAAAGQAVIREIAGIYCHGGEVIGEVQ